MGCAGGWGGVIWGVRAGWEGPCDSGGGLGGVIWGVQVGGEGSYGVCRWVGRGHMGCAGRLGGVIWGVQVGWEGYKHNKP